MAVIGVLASLIERSRSGKGQVVEIDMVRGSLRDDIKSWLMSRFPQVTGTRYASIFPLTVARPSSGLPVWNEPRGENFLDGGAPWYEVYETQDGEYMSIGAIENHFYSSFL